MPLLAPKPQDGLSSFGLLALRATVGLALCFHGWTKVGNLTGWMDAFPDPAPAPLQALAALSEFAGGLALAAGLLTPLAGIGILCTMGYAVKYHLDRGDPFVSSGGAAYELPLTYAVAAICILLCGPGRISLDQVLFAGKKK